MQAFSPREIVSELDRFIIGQDDAKKAVAIALRNRWRRQQLEGEIKEEIANSSGPTITLTCIKHCTGANIPAWGSFVFMRPIGDSVKFFEQATGRVGRSYFNKETNS